VNLFQRLFGSGAAKSDAPQKSTDVGHPIMPERTDGPMPAVHEVSAYEAAGMVENGEVQVLDVRYAHEYDHHHIPGARLIPLATLAARYHELESEKLWLIVCEHGMRSFQACSFLNSLGFTELYNMHGGLSAYPGKQEGTGVKGN
jgi:rhodanese-related sulfurtransferase